MAGGTFNARNVPASVGSRLTSQIAGRLVDDLHLGSRYGCTGRIYHCACNRTCLCVQLSAGEKRSKERKQRELQEETRLEKTSVTGVDALECLGME